MLLIFMLCSVALIARAVNLQIMDTEFLQGEGKARYLRKVKIASTRGVITDRNGEPLAVSTPVDSVWVNPPKLLEYRENIKPLAELLEADAEVIERKLTQRSGKHFVWLSRRINPNKADAIRALKIPGVNLQKEYRRFYPAGEVTAHVIGFTNIDDIGQEGLELAYDSWLAGSPGSKRIIKNRLGQTVEEVELIKEAVPGQDLHLSIDKRLQYLAYRELKSTVLKHGARSGSVVVLDVESGEILAMVNQPSYNPNDGAQRMAERYRNRAITDIFEPGSSIKPLVVSAALESGRFRPGSVIDTAPGFVDVGAKRIEDTRNLGRVSLTTILARSSNVGVTKLAMELEAEQLWQTMSQFGLGELTSSGFPGESTGSLSHFSYWRPISQATLAYGYGVSVTALQLAHAYAALAGDGSVPDISLLARETAPQPTAVVSEDTARAVRRMLEEVVRPGGTGTKASVTGYRIAGKTGTAWKSGPGGYSEDEYISIFAGLAPASEPRLAAVVMIDEPSGELYYGSDVAAPVFADVMAEALRLLAVPPDALPARDAGSVIQAMAGKE